MASASQHWLGIHPHSLGKLASADHDHTHARLPAIRADTPAGITSLTCSSHSRRCPSFSRAAAHDGCAVAKRICSCHFRCTPVACGVGRMDRRTQGRAERCFLHANSARILPLHARTIDWPVFDVGVGRRSWAAVQTDAGYIAICPVTSGLLAARAISSHPRSGADVS